jgi:hypothetical protein
MKEESCVFHVQGHEVVATFSAQKDPRAFENVKKILLSSGGTFAQAEELCYPKAGENTKAPRKNHIFAR